MKKTKSKGTIYYKDGHYKLPDYVQSRLVEFVEEHHQHFEGGTWIWKDFSDCFGQDAVGTVRNWFHDGIPKNQMYFVHLVLERHKY